MVRVVGRLLSGMLPLLLTASTALGQAANPTAAPRPTRVVATTPGYEVLRLPLPPSVLPSCMAVRPDGTLAIGSMDGEVMLVVDTDDDGVLDTYKKFAGNLPPSFANQYKLVVSAVGNHSVHPGFLTGRVPASTGAYTLTMMGPDLAGTIVASSGV